MPQAFALPTTKRLTYLTRPSLYKVAKRGSCKRLGLCPHLPTSEPQPLLLSNHPFKAGTPLAREKSLSKPKLGPKMQMMLLLQVRSRLVLQASSFHARQLQCTTHTLTTRHGNGRSTVRHELCLWRCDRCQFNLQPVTGQAKAHEPSQKTANNRASSKARCRYPEPRATAPLTPPSLHKHGQSQGKRRSDGDPKQKKDNGQPGSPC
mmetsp:Transcript_54762/g.91269  ORF Transcript_54762/g.91269 Transcript_54762/m.91269 type:complete len:206 (-) Transcript_54762:202-819(-)